MPKKVVNIRKGYLFLMLVPLGALLSCASVDYSNLEQSFDACKKGCDQDLSRFDVPVFCLALNVNAMVQYDSLLRMANETAYALGVDYGGCGCARTEILPDGRLSSPSIVFSSSEDAQEIFLEATKNVRVASPIEACLIGSEVPVIFGADARSGMASWDRLHTIYPVRKMIAEESLREVTGISQFEELSWVGLNKLFAIVYVNKKLYLAEAGDYCLPLDAPRDYAINSPEDEAALVVPNQIVVEGCELNKLYEISSTQAKKLRDLSLEELFP